MAQKSSVDLDIDMGQYTFSDHLFIKLYMYCTNKKSSRFYFILQIYS